MSSEELMYANWQHMIKPEKIQVSSNPSYGKLYCHLYMVLL
jgi:DNA-directed RNA polymerase subunit alpha